MQQQLNHKRSKVITDKSIMIITNCLSTIQHHNEHENNKIVIKFRIQQSKVADKSEFNGSE